MKRGKGEVKLIEGRGEGDGEGEGEGRVAEGMKLPPRTGNFFLDMFPTNISVSTGNIWIYKYILHNLNILFVLEAYNNIEVRNS